MKIAFNPSTVAALTAPPNNKDITFDLRGRNIFARGVKFYGTDTNTWRDIKVNNVSIGSHTLDLRNGSNTTLTNTNGVVTINSTWRPVVDNLTSDSTTSSLSAKQGKVLKALIDGKSDSDHNHDDRYVRAFGITNDNIDSDWGQSFKTFDPIPSGTPPEQNPNISLLSICGCFNRRKQLAFMYNNDNIYYRRHVDGVFTNWRRLAFANEIPDSLKNPYALTISLNGTSQGPYDGSAAKSINITPGSIGAATSDHNHDGRYVYNYGGTHMDGASVDKNALGMTTNSGITGEWWHILQAAWNDEYRWNSQIAFPTQNRNGMYYRSGLDDNTKWGAWVKLLDTGNSSISGNTITINGSSLTVSKSDHNHDYLVVNEADEKSFNSAYHNFQVLYAGGGNGITGRPDNVDAFGLIRLRAAWGWSGQMLLANGGSLYIRSSADAQMTNTLAWRTILDSSNYSSILDSRYYTESEVNSLLSKKLDRVNLSVGTWNPRGYHLAADYYYNGGDLSISENGGKMYVSIDGWFYQNEGQYRVLDTSDIGSIRGSLTLNQYLSSTDNNWFPLVWGGSDHKNTNNSTGSLYKSHDKLSWQTSSQTLYATNIRTENIKNLSIGGGIYWNPYVESATDGSDAASITLVKSGVAGGTTLVLSQMNDSNDTIQFKTGGSARLYHNSYPILTTQNTYVNNSKGYINGIEITQVNNSDTVDGYHADKYIMVPTTIDASALDASTYYPVTIWLPTKNTRIEVEVSLDSGTKPSWSTHNLGFTTRKVWESNGSGWGTTSIERNIFVSVYSFASEDPVRGIGQLTNSSIEYVYVRGGGKYFFKISVGGGKPTLQKAKYTTNNQSVAPTKTAPALITPCINTPHKNVTLWGQNFNGNNNVSGTLSGVANIQFSANNAYDIGSNSAASRYIYTHWLGSKSGANLRLAANNSDNQIVLHTNGNVGIGTNSPSYKLYVNGSEFINGASNVRQHVYADGFSHRGHNSNDAVLLAGGGYSQGVPVKYWSIVKINIQSDRYAEGIKRGGNYTFLTNVKPYKNGSCVLTLRFPSGYNYNNTMIWAMGQYKKDSASDGCIYATIMVISVTDTGAKCYLNLADDATLNNGACQLYFMCF